MRMGRITDSKTLAEIIKLKKEGVKNGVICQKVGIARETLIKWRQDGKELFEQIQNEELSEDELEGLEKIKLNFYTEFEGANADFIIKHHKKVSNARGWQSSAWLLSRHDSESYSERREQVKEVNEDGEEVQVSGASILEEFDKKFPEQAHLSLLEKMEIIQTFHNLQNSKQEEEDDND